MVLRVTINLVFFVAVLVVTAWSPSASLSGLWSSKPGVSGLFLGVVFSSCGSRLSHLPTDVSFGCLFVRSIIVLLTKQIFSPTTNERMF